MSLQLPTLRLRSMAVCMSSRRLNPGNPPLAVEGLPLVLAAAGPELWKTYFILNMLYRHTETAPVGRKLSCARGTGVATPPRPVPGLGTLWSYWRRDTDESCTVQRGQASNQAKPPRLPVTASDAAEDSSRVGGSPGKQLDRRGIVIWRQSRLFAPATSHSLRLSATRSER